MKFSDNVGNFQEKISLSSILFIVTVMVMPHIMLFHHFLPLRIIGKSLWLSSFLISMFLCAMYALFKSKKQNDIILSFSSFFLLLVVMLIRSEVYDVDIVGEIIYARSLLFIPLMLIAALYYTKDRRVMNIVIGVIITTGLIQALIGFVHIYIFPEIVTGTYAGYQKTLFLVDSINGRKFLSRESGTMGNPAQYADLICLGICLFAWARPKIKSFPNSANFIFHILFYVIMLLGIIPSLCRLPIVFSVLFIISSFVRLEDLSLRKLKEFRMIKIKGIKSLSILGLAFISIVAFYIYLKFPQLIQRFSIGNYGRTQKNEVLFEFLTSEWKPFFIGMPSDLKLSLRTPEGFGFGDNSYLTLFAAFGFFALLGWAINLILYIKSELSFNYAPLKLFFIVYIFINYSIGDTILADGWNMFLLISTVYLFNNKTLSTLRD